MVSEGAGCYPLSPSPDSDMLIQVGIFESTG